MMDQAKIFLIVDDEPDMCWALENILRKNGFVTEKASSGKEALAAVKPNRFHLAFMDVKLPDIEGLELAKQIREVDPMIRILMVSGYFYRDDEGIRKALAEGLISGFISKPFNNEDILKTIANSHLW